jgi:hypothetical protein
MNLEPSDLKGAWHQIELSRHIAHRDFRSKEQPLHARERRKAPWEQAQGHSPRSLKKEKSCAKGAKGAEFQRSPPRPPVAIGPDLEPGLRLE